MNKNNRVNDTLAAIAAAGSGGATSLEIAQSTGISETSVRKHIRWLRDRVCVVDHRPSPGRKIARNVAAWAVRAPPAVEEAARVEMEARVRREEREAAEKYLDEQILPFYRRKKEQFERVVAARRGVMDRATFNLIRRCLHPDTHGVVSEEIRRRAWDAFAALEVVLLAEKDHATGTMPVPQTLDELKRSRGV